MSEWFLHPVGSYTVTLGTTILLLIVGWVFGLPKGRLTPSRRRILLALRGTIVLLMLLAMLRPTLVHTTVRRQTATLALLIDESRSMTMTDGFGGTSRFESATKILRSCQPILSELQSQLEMEVHPYTFAQEVVPRSFDSGSIDLPKTPDGPETALGMAMDDVLKREAGKRLAGLVVVSDGAQRTLGERATDPQLAARHAGELGCPIYAVTIGQARGANQGSDLAVREVTANPTVYVKNELLIKATIRAEGFSGKSIPVQLLWETDDHGMQPVTTQVVVPRSDAEEVAVELQYAPPKVGDFRWTVSIPPQEGERNTTNNQRTSYVNVLEGGVRLLVIEGMLTPEQKWVRRSLDSSKEIHVDYVYLRDRTPDHLTGNLVPRLSRKQCDALILRDVDSSLLSQEELQAIAEGVNQGMGLMMMGGLHSFGPGGYFSTSLAPLLPVIMEPTERQPLGSAIRADVHLAGPLKIKPTRNRSFIMTLANSEAENRRHWDEMPPLDGANKFRRLKPTGQVIAETAEGAPLLVTQVVGGRVAAFAADSTWHWVLEGKGEEHKRFWRQLVLWLANREEQSTSGVWLHLSDRRIAPGARLPITAGATPPDGTSRDDLKVAGQVISPSGATQAIPVTLAGEQWNGTINQTQAPGEYHVEWTATAQGKLLGKAESRFLVYEQDLELDNPAADPTLMANLARLTSANGGRSLPPEELPSLLRELLKHPPEQEVTVTSKSTPWDSWPFFLLFVAVISTEWGLRKHWGLV